MKGCECAVSFRRIAILLMTIALMTGMLPALPAQAGVKKCRTTESAKLYKEASTDCQSVSVKEGQSVSVYEVRGSWAKVKVGGKKGFMKKSALETVDSSESSASEKSTQSKSSSSGKTYYVKSTAAVYASASSSSKKLDSVDMGAKVTVTSHKGSWARVQRGSDVGYMKKSVLTSKKPSSSSGSVKKMNWWNSGIQSIFSRGSTAKVTDVRTGISFSVRRKGGTKHADTEPLTKSDTRKMKKASGGSWSWNRRPIIVTIGGKRYAASMNTMPHGESSLDNGYPGHFCIHFTESHTHGSDKVDAAHQSAINTAAKAK